MAVEKITRGFAVNTDDVKALIKDLKAAGPAASRGLRTTIKSAAEIVAVEARSNASQHSQSIPPTIKARTYLSATKASAATITAGKGVPLAALYELGNVGGRDDSKTFRHPVFERNADTGKLEQTDAWVEQARYPYLQPALDKTAPEVEAALKAVADVASDIIAVRRLY